MPLGEKLSRYRDQDRSLTALLAVLGLNILVLSPAAHQAVLLTLLARGSLLPLLLAGILTMRRGAFRAVALGWIPPG